MPPMTTVSTTPIGKPAEAPQAKPRESILQRRITLTQLVDLESFREVMKSFSDLYRVGVKVFDVEGSKLVDVRVASGAFCGYLFEFGSTRKLCTTLVTALKNDPLDDNMAGDAPRTVDCFSGLQYVILPITYEGDALGRVIFGPYLPSTMKGPSEELVQIEPKLDRQKLDGLIEPVRRAPIALVEKVLDQLQKIIEVIIFTSYRALLTSQMHIESVTSSYHELQEKNRTLKDANERLQELDKMKSNFLATVSHELRTPLTSVIGYSEMLLEGMAGSMNDEQRDYVKTIMDKGEMLLSLISQILDLSRIESGNLTLHKSVFDVGDAMKKAISSVLPQAQKKKLNLDVRVAPELPRFLGDRDKIVQIVVNLVGNAVKFTPESGRVSLHVDRTMGPRRSSSTEDTSGASALFDLADEPYLRLVIEDTGVGIPKEKLAAVFERFFQVDNSSTREHGGTGLGLSIVKNFVSGHDGQVLLESDTGQGARFTVLLPYDV
jgi:two-component system sensor histidine kinase BarA